MKTLLILLLPLFSIAQMSGIPEQDYLLMLKDNLKIKAIKQEASRDLKAVETYMLYEWTHYQWLQWLRGSVKRKCIYSCKINSGYFIHSYISKCPDDGEKLIPCTVKDTLIKEPLPISYEGFLRWRVEQVLSKN